MIKNVFLNDFFSKTAKVKYTGTKKAIAISKEDPSELYPDFDFFIELLNSENQIIKWTAIQVIGNLSKVDKKKKVDKPYVLQYRLLNSTHTTFDMLKEWHGNHKFATLELAEAYVAKQKRANRLVRYEFRIVSK